MCSKREMNLKEWVAQLPPTHSARIEYEEIMRAARALLDATIEDAGEDDFDDGPVALCQEPNTCAVTFKQIRELKAALK